MQEQHKDLFEKIGIDVSGEKISIDLGKTRGFFAALQAQLTQKVENLQQNIAEGKVDQGENIGIKIDNEHIDIDLGKTKHFIEDLGKKIEGFVAEIDKSIKDINKKPSSR